MTNILLTGAISLSNKGTCAILISTIDTIKKIIPDANITVELFYADKQRDIYPLDINHNVKISEPPIQKPMHGMSVFIYTAIFSHIRKIFPNLKFGFPKHYIDADIVIDISAEAFIKYYDDDTLQYTQRYLLHLYPLMICIFLKKRIVLFAQTLAPFGFFKPIMAYLIRKSVYVSVRDEISIENLKKEGIDTSNIYVSADPAFLLDPSSKKKVNQILLSEGIDLDNIKNEKCVMLGITLAKNTGRVFSEVEFKKMTDIVSKSLNQSMIDNRLFVLFIPHSSGKIRPESDDVLVGYELEKNITDKSRFFVIKGDYWPQDIKGLIGECDIFLSLRMHPVIAALSLGIPNILIAFNDKAYGLMRRFELEHYVCDIRILSEEDLRTKLAELIAKDSEINKLIDAKIPKVDNLIINDFKNLNNILNHQLK